MSPHLVTVDGHLVYTPDGHLANYCAGGYSAVCTDCKEIQPNMSLTYNDGACVMNDTGVYPYWRYYEGGGTPSTICYWEWLFNFPTETEWYVRLSHTPGTPLWQGAMFYIGAGTAHFGDGGTGAKDLTSDIDCDESGIIDHLVAAPFTLESNTKCGSGGIISVTLNV